ncbi:mRNA cap guanine-N7 methyltransferase [Wickerhamomyces ciferrii]|uniref:mRNA cap guanine-N(7) methyltransferase n=1 Tax=Wickerhamomyces ciferrii (strain ATCC 14091 / BCRC 22168 / CBS 111 / JCM 3599 / NBRC 0793 / NRRL Y-1031 F-60-10) TaxID=1206466 RepID=K0KCD7_WICCF|nr:mRNA cap guanine-N7 methyltransferase [Wickerhamomyces ciferrii]CCH40561.1 mRNA cap guanine-N7 methyltransferase [Wickerhamomyces ciferrii]
MSAEEQELPKFEEPQSSNSTTSAETKDTTASETQDQTTESDKPKDKAPENPNKIRKRAVPAAQPSGFSSRRRGGDTRSASPSVSRGSPAPPPWAKKTAKDPNERPAWMKVEDYNMVHNANSEPITAPPTESNTDGPPQKLRRPGGRGGVDDQRYRARQERERYEEQHNREREEQNRRNENLDQIVRQHYNQRAYVAKRSRRNLSPIIKLRNFNNVIKYILIGNYAQPGWRTLDLGCGKGGDINKWDQAKISEYIGIDISNASIVEAIKRYKNNEAGFQSTFITGDCFGQPLPYILNDHPHVQLDVDIVSMQFCMHYAFETEMKARTLLENVSRSLRPGGIFIGTIPSSDFIKERISKMQPGEKSFGNSIYSVTFDNEPPRNGEFRPAFGQRYTYFLKDAIDNVPEYVVPFESLRSLADEFGLELTYKKPFLDLYKEEIPTWFKKLNPRLVEGMRRSDGSYGVEGDEKEAAAFYLAFAFQKVLM